MKTILGFVLFALAAPALAQAPWKCGGGEEQDFHVRRLSRHSRLQDGLSARLSCADDHREQPVLHRQRAAGVQVRGAQPSSMRGIAQSLSEQDMADLAAYYSTEHK